MAKKILLTNKGIHPYLPKALTKLGFQVDFDYTSTKAEIADKIGGYYGIVMKSRFRADKSFFKSARKLRFLSRVGVGFEHIDMEYAKKKGIEIILSPEGSRDAVGEHSMGLLLCVLNNLSKGDREIREGEWLREPNRGVELKGKTGWNYRFWQYGASHGKTVGWFWGQSNGIR